MSLLLFAFWLFGLPDISCAVFLCQVFDSNGKFLRQFPNIEVSCLAFDSAGNIIVVQSTRKRVQVLSPTGEFITQFLVDQLVYGVCVDDDDRIFVSGYDAPVRCFGFPCY